MPNGCPRVEWETYSFISLDHGHTLRLSILGKRLMGVTVVSLFSSCRVEVCIVLRLDIVIVIERVVWVFYVCTIPCRMEVWAKIKGLHKL